MRRHENIRRVLRSGRKTNHILADKDRDTGDTKLHFVTENPTIKFEAASKTEVADLPIYEWPHMNVSQSNKWVLDCVFDWDGKFDDEAQHVLKKLSNDFQGSTEWSAQWDGSYIDHVKNYCEANASRHAQELTISARSVEFVGRGIHNAVGDLACW